MIMTKFYRFFSRYTGRMLFAAVLMLSGALVSGDEPAHEKEYDDELTVLTENTEGISPVKQPYRHCTLQRLIPDCSVRCT